MKGFLTLTLFILFLFAKTAEANYCGPQFGSVPVLTPSEPFLLGDYQMFGNSRYYNSNPVLSFVPTGPVGFVTCPPQLFPPTMPNNNYWDQILSNPETMNMLGGAANGLIDTVDGNRRRSFSFDASEYAVGTRKGRLFNDLLSGRDIDPDDYDDDDDEEETREPASDITIPRVRTRIVDNDSPIETTTVVERTETADDAVVIEAVNVANEVLTGDVVTVPGLIPDCLNFVTGWDRDPAAVLGVYRVMANLYQSCDVLSWVLDEETELMMGTDGIESESRPDEKFSLNETRSRSYQSLHPYISRLEEPGESCRDISTAPPTFVYAGKSELNDNQLNLFANQNSEPYCQYNSIDCASTPLTGLDSSGLMEAALRAEGLRIRPNGEEQEPDYSTSMFLGQAQDASSCIEYPEMNSDTNLLPGDMVTLSGQHMVMITKVGADPMGIKKALAEDKCHEISRSDLDFEFAQSSNQSHVGVVQADPSFPGTSRTLMANLVAMAQKICLDSKEEKKTKPFRENSNGSAIEFGIIRHKGKEKSECVGPKPVLIGDECIQGCGP